MKKKGKGRQTGRRKQGPWGVIKQVVEESDLVIVVLDARMPDLSRNEDVERMVKENGKKILFVLNKADLVSLDTLRKDKRRLIDEGFECIFTSSKRRSVNLTKLIGLIFKNLRGIKPVDTWGRPRKFTIGIIGYPNTGKSSLINALTKRSKAKVSKKAGTTHGIQWVRFGEKVRISDSPGIIPLRKDDPVRYGLLGARDPHRLRELEKVIYVLLEWFLLRNPEALGEFTGIKLGKRDDPDDVIEKISKKRGFLKRGGLPDENRTYIFLLKSWNAGLLKF